MTLETDLQAAVTKTQNASQKLHDIVNGDSATTVTTESGPVKTMAKVAADNEQTLNNSLSTLTTMRDEAVASATAAETARDTAEDWAQQASNAVQQTFVEDADGNTGIETERVANEDKIRVKTAGVDRMMVNNNGWVGIGETVSPEALLHLKDFNSSPELFLEGLQTANSHPRITLGEGNPDTGFSWVYNTSTNQLQLKSQSGGTDKGKHISLERDTGEVRIMRDTMFGDDSAPSDAHLQVRQVVDNSGVTPHDTKSLLKLNNGQDVAGSKAVLEFYQGSGESVYLNGERQADDTIDFVAGTRTSGTGYQEHMRVKTSGNIGVGTTSPSEKLHIANGLIKIDQANGNENNSPAITCLSNDDFLYDGVYLSHYGLGFHSYQDETGVNGRNFYASGFFGMDFFTAGQNRLRINENGKIGLGTVTPNEKLSVNGVLSIKNQTATPSASPDYGKVYPKNDGKLYYLNESGQEFALITGAVSAVGMPETNMPGQSLVIKGDDGKLYTRGYERICGRGGVTEGSNMFTFAPVWLPDDFGTVGQVWCGWDYVIVASATQNKIATFGNPAEGVLGTGNTSWFQGVNVINLPAKAVECVTNEYSPYTSERGFIVRLENNDCYAYGWNGEQCLDDAATQTNNAMLTGYKLAHQYLHIGGYTGVNGMVFGVDASDYKTYVWGMNLRGAAGINHGGSIPMNNLIGPRRPVQVVPGSASEHVVKTVVSYQAPSSNHYASAGLLTNTGKLYTCGWNGVEHYLGYPQSSNNNGDQQTIPQLLATDVVDFSIKLWVGGWLKKSDGQIQTWGRSLSGWRGNGLNNDTRTGPENWNGTFFIGKNTKVGWAQSYIYDDGGAMAFFVLDLDSGKLYSAGSNSGNANGQCDNLNSWTPTISEVQTGGVRIKDFNFKGSGGGRHERSAPLLIMENGQIWATGLSDYHMVSATHGGGDNIMHWVSSVLSA